MQTYFPLLITSSTFGEAMAGCEVSYSSDHRRVSTNMHGLGRSWWTEAGIIELGFEAHPTGWKMLLRVTRLLVNRVTKSSSILRPRRRFWTRPKYDGPEPPNGFLFNEKVRTRLWFACKFVVPLAIEMSWSACVWMFFAEFPYSLCFPERNDKRKTGRTSGFNLFLMVFIAVYKPNTARWQRTPC